MGRSNLVTTPYLWTPLPYRVRVSLRSYGQLVVTLPTWGHLTLKPSPQLTFPLCTSREITLPTNKWNPDPTLSTALRTLVTTKQLNQNNYDYSEVLA